MKRWVLKATHIEWQASITIFLSAILGLCLFFPDKTNANIADLDRSTFVTALSGIATIIALFCSLSIAWILSVYQRNNSERIEAYDKFKSHLAEAHGWLLTQPDNKDRTICLSFAYELSKFDVSDLPQLHNYGPEHLEYCDALAEGLDSDDSQRREFFLTSSTYFQYIEQLLSRIGLIAIRQVCARSFIQALAKGVVIVVVAIATLVVSMMWFNDHVKPWLVIFANICSVATVLLIVEVLVDLYRNYKEDLDFIDSEN